MADYMMAIGKKGIFYIGPADLSTNERLKITEQEFRYPQFVTIPNFDKEIKEKVAEFFQDHEIIRVLKSKDAINAIHEIFIKNKREYNELNRE